jgi:hypothetical protein
MELEIIDHQQVAGFEGDFLISHAKAGLRIERHEELEALVPGGAPGVPARAVVKKLDQERELFRQFHAVMTATIKLGRDIVSFELELVCHRKQFAEVLHRGGIFTWSDPTVPGKSLLFFSPTQELGDLGLGYVLNL